MVNKIIAYQNDNGSVTIVHPSPDCGLMLEQIALKDVPKNLPFVYVNVEDIPKENMFFGAFEVDVSNPHGYGADWGQGSTNTVVGWNYDGSPITKAELG